MRRRPVISTIFFDAGGTLVYLDYAFVARELKRVGIKTSVKAIQHAEYAAKAEIDERMLRAVADTDESRRRPYFAALLEQLGVEEKTAAWVLERLEAAHRKDNLWRVMLPSTPNILEELRKRGFTLGVISNADGRIAAILRKCGILPFFDSVIDSHEVRVEKPDPRIFLMALSQASARPEEAVYVGDIYSIDVVGANRAGMRAFLLDSLDAYDSVRCEKIRHLGELLSVFDFPFV